MVRQEFLISPSEITIKKDSGKQKFKLYTDGGSRGNDKGEGNGQGAGAWLIIDEEENIIDKGSRFFGTVTNNVAEYMALIEGLKNPTLRKSGMIACYSDSSLLINQMKGKFKVKNEHLKELILEAKKHERTYAMVLYEHVFRTNPFIRVADKLLNETLDLYLHEKK